jgi:hypothetical protein
MVQRGAGDQPESGVRGASGTYDEQAVAAVVADCFLGLKPDEFGAHRAVRGEPEELTSSGLQNCSSGPAFLGSVRVA